MRPDGGIIEQVTAEFFKQFKVDYALVGISAIDEDGMLLDFDFQEVGIFQHIILGAWQIFGCRSSSSWALCYEPFGHFKRR